MSMSKAQLAINSTVVPAWVKLLISISRKTINPPPVDWASICALVIGPRAVHVVRAAVARRRMQMRQSTTKTILASILLVCMRGYAVGTGTAALQFQSEVALVEMYLQAVIPSIKTEFKAFTVSSPTRTIDYYPSASKSAEENALASSTPIASITYGWANPDESCSNSNNSNDGISTSGFTACLVDFTGDDYSCPHNFSDRLLIEVRFKPLADMPEKLVSMDNKKLLFVALDSSLQEIDKYQLSVGSADSASMGEIQFFKCINVDGHPGDGINDGIRLGGQVIGAYRAQLGAGYSSAENNLELPLCFGSYPDPSTALECT